MVVPPHKIKEIAGCNFVEPAHAPPLPDGKRADHPLRWSTQMLRHLALLALPCVAAIAMASSLAPAQSPNGVKTLDPPGAVKAEGTWSLGARAGDFVFVAGMQGIDPATNILVPDP